ncbi:MAG: 7,8-didemethyl-8-hydroxy-5-deazariboflavin synthase CofG, partial [Actinomycetes bacterium]
MTIDSPADLISASVSDLCDEASKLRNRRTGNRITYSPKVFIPLTMLCRDRCGYCTFAKAPARLESPFMEIEEILELAQRGSDAGCHEALFTLGEAPEDRYELAQRWLQGHGYQSTVEYLVDACAAVVKETGLLPHANAGALSKAELLALREVSASQGMMLESLRGDLEAHRLAPDKTPERRLATLEAAGELAIPFTTGVLVGIGENRQDILDALLAIGQMHERYGHIQEVIVQNFLPKPGTAMANHLACDPEEHRWAIAAARLLLPADIHIQAPPNL